jgi:hypothetical protein
MWSLWNPDNYFVNSAPAVREDYKLMTMYLSGRYLLLEKASGYFVIAEIEMTFSNMRKLCLNLVNFTLNGMETVHVWLCVRFACKP